MKKCLKIFAVGAVLTLPNASIGVAASSGYSEFVESITWETGIGGPSIAVANLSNSNFVKDVQLGATQQTVNFPIDATVKCAKDKDIDFNSAVAYFGPVGMGGLDNINASAALHSDGIAVGSQTWAGNLTGWINESSQGGDVFSVPLAKIAAGHPTVRVDPVAEIQAKLQQHIQGGGNALDFYRNDQSVQVTRSISVAGACSEGNLVKWGFITKSLTIFINYEGDPGLQPSLNAQLGGNLPNAINQQLPFELLSADFMANVPHHIAACPPEVDPSLRVTLNGSGGVPGNVGVRIYEDGAGMIHETTVQLNPQNAGAPIDFDYPLKARLQSSQAWNVVNKTFEHKLRVRARYQDSQGQWTSWSEYDSVIFKHRCTPKLNVNLGNTNGGIGGYQQQGGENPIVPQMQVAPQQLPEPPSGGAATQVAPRQTPPPPSAGAATQIAPVPLDPAPTTPTQIQRAPVEPVEKPKRATN